MQGIPGDNDIHERTGRADCSRSWLGRPPASRRRPGGVVQTYLLEWLLGSSWKGHGCGKGDQSGMVKNPNGKREWSKKRGRRALSNNIRKGGMKYAPKVVGEAPASEGVPSC